MTRELIYAATANVAQDIKVNDFGDKVFQANVEVLRQAALALLDLREGIETLAKRWAETTHEMYGEKPGADSELDQEVEMFHSCGSQLRALLTPKSERSAAE